MWWKKTRLFWTRFCHRSRTREAEVKNDMLYRKYGPLLVMLFLLLIPGCSTSRSIGEAEAENSSRKQISGESEAGEWEKGYDLPVEDEKKVEVREECTAVMEALSGIYEAADKGDASNAVLPDETLEQIWNIFLWTPDSSANGRRMMRSPELMPGTGWDAEITVPHILEHLCRK